MLIRSKNVWYADGFRPADLVISAGKIEAVYPYGKGEGKLCQPDEVRDYGTLRILPGFIDIHTHGAYGYDTNDGDPEGLKMWARRLPEEGVTAFLPTTVTDKHEVLLNAASSIRKALDSDNTGAEILGLHLEGPYFDADHKGAQPQKALRPASIEEFRQLQEASAPSKNSVSFRKHPAMRSGISALLRSRMRTSGSPGTVLPRVSGLL